MGSDRRRSHRLRVCWRAAGAFLVVENTFATDSMKQRKGRTAPLTMIDSFYFVATTISTVGSAVQAP